MTDENYSSTFHEDFTESFQLSKFEVKTLAFFQLNKNFNKDSVKCISSPSYIVIALENNVSIYKEDTQELFWEFKFNSNCDNVALSDDLCLLLVVEKPGKLNLIHIPSFKIIWSYECEENGSLCTIKNVIFSSALSGFLSIYALTNEDILFDISPIETLALYKAVEDDTVSDFFNGISVKKIELCSMFPDFFTKSTFETFSWSTSLGLEGQTKIGDISLTDYYIVEDMIDGDFMADWEWKNEEIKYFKLDLSGYGEMIKILCTRDGRYIVCLDKKYMLSIFSAFTHLNLAAFGDGDIKDFVLYETIDSTTFSLSDSKIGILRKSKDGHMFEVRKFPSFDFIHKTHLSGFAQLVRSKPNQELWYIIEGSLSPDDKACSYLNVKSVSESSPEARLMSLVNRRKFKQAEKYAKMHNLKDEIIFKAKINCMLKDSAKQTAILSKSDQECIWKEVESALNKIKDVDFIKSCVSSLEPEIEIMRKFHSCINNWLFANNIEGAEDLICEINQNENKLLTYNVLPKSVQINLSVKEFLRKDLLQFMITELTERCLDAALIIWQRHKNEILSSLSSEQIQEILNAVPDDIPSYHLITFLEEDFLPFILIKLPEAIDIIADWIIPHIHLLELTEKELWPENGYQLASMFLELIRVLQEKAGKGAISYSVSISLACTDKKIVNSDFRTGYLFELYKTLKHLIKLKKKFNCKVSLTVFQESKLDGIFAVLDRINLNFINEAIYEFAKPYALENNIDLDLSLELYIKNTLQTSHFTWWSWDEAPWEERLTAVLECILDTERWIKAALMLISHATVPWTNKIKKIVEQGLSLDHASKDQFKKQSKEVSLKEILVKYELRNLPMNGDIQLAYTLVNYILKQNRESAFEDAKIVILAHCDILTCEAYKNILQFFINQNKLDELASLLESIPSDIAIKCSYSLLCNISLFLGDDFLMKNSHWQVENYLGAGIYLFEFLKLKKQPVDQLLFDAFQSFQKLQKEFGMYITLCNILSKENACEIVERFICSVLDKAALSEESSQLDKKSTSVSLGIFKIKRLGCILGLEVANVLAVLITNCLQRKMYNLVIEICGELISSYPATSSSETLIKVVNHFYQNFQNIKNMSFESIVAAVCHLSNLAVTHCESDSIGKCMNTVRLSTYFSFLNKITGHHVSFLSSMKTDIFHKWRLTPIYEDEGFQLDLDLVADFVLKVIPLSFRHSSNLEQAIDFSVEEMFNIVYKPIINHMKEKGQELAALRTIYLFYHLQMEFLQNEASRQQDFSLISNCIKDSAINLLRRLIDKRKLDMELSVGLLALFPTEQSQILKKLKGWSAKDLKCIMSLGEIGSECCRVFENPEYHEYETMYRRALLLLKQNIKITQTHIALNSSDSDYNWGIAKEIILCPKTNLSTIFEFCSAFDFIPDHVLIAFLNNLLIESEKLCLANTEIPEDSLQLLLNRTKCAIEAVNSEELIVKNLESLLKKISPYSYEVLLFVHEQLLCASANFLTISSGQFEKTIALLNFLRVYERVSPPGEIEFEQWISVHPTDVKLPVVANKRLPFSCIFEDVSYKIINPELTATTLTVWLTIAPLLNTSKDELVVIAVKNAVTAYLKKIPVQHIILNQDKSFLHNLYEMLQNIRDPQLSVACATWLANRIPPGANKVCSCLIALKFAEKWHELLPNDRKSLDVLKKSKEFYQRSSIEMVLYRNNLANDVSLSYSQNPVQLVEYFTEEFCLTAESSVKICKASVEISKVINIDLNEIFKKKILKWLYTSQTSNNLDETFSFDDSIEAIETEDDSEAKNLLKAINLLLGLSSIDHNICNNLKEDFRTMTIIQRSKLIFCMVAVYGNEFVAESLNMASEELEESMPSFLCTAELEHLHLRYSRDIAPASIELVQNILSNQSNNSKVLLCCVKICLENKIWSSYVWDIILQRLIMLSMAEPLQDILLTSQGHLTHMWHNKSFISAWNCIISNCYKSEQTDVPKVIEKIYKTILSCPCVSALDVESLWNDLKYFVKSTKGRDLKELEPISDASAFIQALKNIQDSCFHG